MSTRVAVFSDSHGDKRAICDLLERMGHIDAACFLGDVESDADYLNQLLGSMPHCPPFCAVRGNNDYASLLPDSRICEFGGKRLYLTHGHLHRDLMGLALRAKESGADAALFGHTHVPLCEEAYGVLLLNPGSAGNYCRGGAARACVLVIDGEEMRVEAVGL